MKKILPIIFNLFTVIAFAQLSLKKSDGTAINNNDVLIFTSNVDPNSYLGFKLYNSSAQDINVKVECTSLVNATGSDVQLCLGNVCLSGIEQGTSYPNDAAIIPANGQNGNFDHFLNTATGIVPSSIVEYGFKFFQVNALNEEIGNSISFVYRYTPALGTNNFNLTNDFGVVLKSTLVAKQLEFINENTINCQIFDLSGKSLLMQQINTGNNTIDVKYLQSGIYFVQLTNTKNQKTTIKFIKN